VRRNKIIILYDELVILTHELVFRLYEIIISFVQNNFLFFIDVRYGPIFY